MNYLAALFLVLLTHGALAAPMLTAHVTTKKGDLPLALEYAITPESREQGLMFRKTLAPADGMLFIFPSTNPLAFWMKNTPLPLDLMFLDEKGEIVHIARNATPFSEAPIHSQRPARAVIEVQGGQAAARGIAEGDQVLYQLPAGSHVE